MATRIMYPWRTRIGWEVRGFMYYVDVCEAECLDVARGLWLTGAEYLTLYFVNSESRSTWTYMPANGAYRGTQMGGYSGD